MSSTRFKTWFAFCWVAVCNISYQPSQESDTSCWWTSVCAGDIRSDQWYWCSPSPTRNKDQLRTFINVSFFFFIFLKYCVNLLNVNFITCGQSIFFMEPVIFWELPSRCKTYLVFPLKLCPHLSELGVSAGGRLDVVHDVNVDVTEDDAVSVTSSSRHVVHCKENR